MSKTKRKKVEALLRKHGGKCAYCSRKVTFAPSYPFRPTHLAASIDHIVPRSRGGKDEPANWALSCMECNTHKGDTMPEVWHAAIARHPEWWTRAGGGAVLRAHIQTVTEEKSTRDWPWLSRLSKWCRDNSTSGARDFFEC